MQLGCVILNYNDADTTITLLNKIKDYDIFYKICVVDNCSSDDSYDNLIKLHCNKIDVVRTEKNGGYGYGNNFGIQYLKNKYNCEYVLIANPDTLFEEITVKQMINYFDGETAVVAPVALTINHEVQQPISWDCPTKKTFYLFSSAILNKIFHPLSSKVVDMSTDVNEVDCVQGALFMLDIDKFINAGMFDETIFLYFEESTIGIRLKRHHYKTKLITSLSYIHNHSQSVNKVIKSEYKKRKLMIKSLYLLLSNEYGYNFIEKMINNLYLRIVFIENYIIFSLYYLFRK